MPSSELVTRGALARKLAVNAATKPLNVAVLGGLVVAGIVLDLIVVVGAIAIVAYFVLVALTFFDSEEAERVGNELYAAPRPAGRDRAPALDVGTLEPRIAALVEQARDTAAGIHEAIEQADHPFDDVVADVDALVADLEAQRDATARLEERLQRFEVGMRRICASLGLLRTRLVEMSASEEEAAQRDLARQSRELRERTDLLAEAMAEVFADDDDQQVELPVVERRPDG